jgi:hypothetical protein
VGEQGGVFDRVPWSGSSRDGSIEVEDEEDMDVLLTCCGQDTKEGVKRVGKGVVEWEGPGGTAEEKKNVLKIY